MVSGTGAPWCRKQYVELVFLDVGNSTWNWCSLMSETVRGTGASCRIIISDIRSYTELSEIMWYLPVWWKFQINKNLVYFLVRGEVNIQAFRDVTPCQLINCVPKSLDTESGDREVVWSVCICLAITVSQNTWISTAIMFILKSVFFSVGKEPCYIHINR